MKLENKNFIFENIKTLTVKTIENLILNSGYIPLRWAIIHVENNKLTVESSCIKKN